MPGVPTDLRINQTSCEGSGPRFVNRGQIVLNATGADDDNDPLNVTFAVWKVADPADRHEYTTSGGPGVRSVLWLNEPDADNTEYSWAVRASDDTDVSAWSAECRFTTDFVGPAIAPVVTSTDYPNDGGRHGGVGIPGTFTFDAAGDPDTVGFHFETVDRQSYVAADHAGGSATVEYTPTTSAPQMTVQAVDRAGNFSPATVYRFFVADTTPLIEDLTPDVFVGDPHTLKLTSRMPGVTSYSYRLDYGSPSTVAAEADGSAVLSIVPPVDGVMIHFAARTTAGLVSPEGYFYLQTSSAPVISAPGYPADGSPGPTAGSTVSFTFHPHVRGVVAYAYTIDNGPEQTVPAEPDGTATIRYTTVNGAVEIYVYSLTADGTMSEYAGGYYLNTSIAPEVGSADYPAYQTAGAPGVTGAFTFGPGAATGVTAYTYQFSGGPEQPVTADGTGHATVAWTPTAPGWYSLVVRSITASGTQSDAYFYSFAVGSGT